MVPCAGETRSGPLFTGEPFALKSHRDNYVMAHNDGTVDARAVVQNHRTKWILAPTWNATVDIETVHPLDA
ncbi:MAG: hypothetical protein R3A51_02145 [Nannocystaceae bacterium]